MIRIGIRELWQRASRYVESLRRSGTARVTDRGCTGDLLTQTPQDGAIERLSAHGRLSPDMGDVLELGPPLDPEPGVPLPSVELTEMRAEER